MQSANTGNSNFSFTAPHILNRMKFMCYVCRLTLFWYNFIATVTELNRLQISHIKHSLFYSGSKLVKANTKSNRQT